MADTAIFLRDVRDHAMTIEIDQGAHRSIQFKRPGTFAMNFRLVTWPGHLAISGDMGDFTFARTHDMFEFFRDTSGENRINPQYWHEKMEAQDKSCPAKEFSAYKFKQAVKYHTDEFQVRLGDAQSIASEIQTELLDAHPSNQHEAYELIRDFETSDGNSITDFDSDLLEHGYHFVWCLRAIVWGIKQYDLVKEGRTQAEHDKRVLKGWM